MRSVLIAFNSYSPVFMLSMVILLSSPPALTLAQVRLLLPGWSLLLPLLTSYRADQPSSLRGCVRAAHQPHGVLVVLRRHAACDHRFRRDRNGDFEALITYRSLPHPRHTLFSSRVSEITPAAAVSVFRAHHQKYNKVTIHLPVVHRDMPGSRLLFLWSNEVD